jgi:hypothetical protein
MEFFCMLKLALTASSNSVMLFLSNGFSCFM